MNCPTCHRPLGPASEPRQLDLASLATGPKARSHDPATAKAAAIRNEPRRGTQRARVLEAVVRAGAGGATADEIAGVTELPYVSVSTRVSELLRGGWLEPTARTRSTSSGGSAQVVVATAAASDLFNENVPAPLATAGHTTGR